MAKIRVLPPSIAQTIAAGEVVERPASVLKELMENAIDAGSREIVVELKGGGLERIRVRDDGEGMEPDDLPLAFERHATSKLRTAEDLYAIQTLGFRGEALPSIGSVSRMTIRTRVPSSMSGVKVVCEGGTLGDLVEVGCPIGTDVDVQDLFFNLPVKKRFLKSIQTELRHCVSHFVRLGLAYPSIAFKLSHDGKELYDLESDPAEANNIARQQPDVAKKLRGEYDRWFADVAATLAEVFQVGPWPVGESFF